MAEDVGFVGVGRMGGRMARRLIEAGYKLTIYDTSDAAVRPLTEMGALAVDSPAAVGSACDIVLTSLPTPQVVQAAALVPNVISDGKRVKILVDMSTTGATYARRIAEGLKAKGNFAGSPGYGGEGRARCPANPRCHQCRHRTQQRHCRQVP